MPEYDTPARAGRRAPRPLWRAQAVTLVLGLFVALPGAVALRQGGHHLRLRPSPPDCGTVGDCATVGGALCSSGGGSARCPSLAAYAPLRGGMSLLRRPRAAPVTTATAGSDEAPEAATVVALRALDGLPPAAAIWRTALPLFAACLCEPFLTLIDTACVGNMGANTAAGLAALAVNGAVFDVLANVLASLCTATTNVVARASARGPAALRRAVRLSLGISAAIGVSCALVLLFASQPLAASVFSLQAQPLVLERALGYMRVRGAFLPVVCLNYALYGVLLARADTSIAVLAVAVSAVVNLVLDALLVGALGLSTVGAAVATVAAQLSVCATLLRYVERSLPSPAETPRWLPSTAELRPFGEVFGAVGLGTAATALVHACAARVVASSGSVPAAAAHQLGFQVVSLFSCVAVPLNLGVQSLLAAARAKGDDTRVRSLVTAVIGQSALVGVGVGASSGLLLKYGARLLTADPAVAVALRAVVPLCALTCAAWTGTSAMYEKMSFGALTYSAIRIGAYAPLLISAMRPGRGFDDMMRAGRERARADQEGMAGVSE
ncbi:hypothetical protein T492DRAFT_1048854 [Pavlovales sp. CCMP2436]|nr:hypothetical protein T492DRAFT_1048854 [Pavlovales sp. CCMP2436]